MTAPCDVCPVASARARESLGAYAVECVCGTLHRARVVRVYQADPDAPAPHRTALDLAGHAARVADDPELARIRTLLAALRPDCADPMEPPPRVADIPVPTVRISDPSASWGGIPRGLASGLGAMLARAEEMQSRCAADVLREIAALPPDAAAVLRWMRAHATLRDGARGLYVEAGMHFAGAAQTAAWRDLGARRIGAPAHGRRLVLRAADAWDRSHARTPAYPAP